MTTAISNPAASRSGANIYILAIITFLFGAGLIFLTGFSYSSTLHNAAHDPRHALAFPCH